MFLRFGVLRNLLHSCHSPLDMSGIHALQTQHEVDRINVQCITNAVASEDSTFRELGFLEIWQR